MTLTEQFDSLPEPMQEQLIRLARLATGMSADEKGAARVLLGAAALQIVVDSPDENDNRLAVAELMGACGRVVQYADEQAGARASWLVV
jgi:hypothetical protein